MRFLTLEEGKQYLRVDSDYDDSLIEALLSSAEILCCEVARLSEEQWNAVCSEAELLRVSILYTLGYLYEHREEADHHDLVMTLRSLLFSIREGVF